MEEVVSPENYGKALKAVIANRGAPGIDGMKTAELNGHLLKHWPKIHAKLMAGTYTPSPVRRVEIPKPSGGTRMLGIPTVMDRFIQQMILLAMTPASALSKISPGLLCKNDPRLSQNTGNGCRV